MKLAHDPRTWQPMMLLTAHGALVGAEDAERTEHDLQSNSDDPVEKKLGCCSAHRTAIQQQLLAL
eukprot:964281-Amphidinium_carterae.1